MMLSRCKATIIALALFCSPSFATEITHQIPLDGKQFSVQIPVGTTKVTLWGESRGTITVPVHLSVSAPNGTSVVASAVRTRHGDSTAVRDGAWYALPSLETATRPLSRAGAPSLEQQCLQQPETTIRDLIQYLTQHPGGSWDRASVCRYIAEQESQEERPLPEVSTDDTPQRVGDLDLIRRFLIRKDSCKRSGRYLVRFTFDLTRVNYSEHGSGIELKGAASTKTYKGSTVASIKPVSDGKYAPAPLLLMSSIYPTKDRIHLVRWGKSKPRRLSKVEVEGQVGYRGIILTRSLIAPHLTGGHGTFDITDGINGYGVCFRLARVRQRTKGYPGEGA